MLCFRPFLSLCESKEASCIGFVSHRFFLSRFLSSSVAGHGVVLPRAMADLTMARSLTGAASATRGRFPRDEAASAMFAFSEGGGVIRRRGRPRKMVR